MEILNSFTCPCVTLCARAGDVSKNKAVSVLSRDEWKGAGCEEGDVTDWISGQSRKKNDAQGSVDIGRGSFGR